MTFEKIRKLAQPSLKHVLEHPFNTELFAGSLCHAKFKYFLEQDLYYLNNYSQALLRVSQRLTSSRHKLAFERFAHDTVKAEQKIHQQFGIEQASIICEPILNYVSHLERHTKYAPVEIAIASLVPCFWLYKELGQHMAIVQTEKDHPYISWVTSYACPGFHADTEEMIAIMEDVKNTAREEHMKKAFLESIHHELLFWEEVYAYTPPRYMMRRR